MANIIDGKKLALNIRNNLKEKVRDLEIKPGLAVVVVGNDPASLIYVNAKEKACREIGFFSQKIIMPANTTQDELIQLIDRLNHDKKIHGILIQFPLPRHLSEQKITEVINPQKDVDCFSPINVGRLFSAKKITGNMLIPCTPKGIMTLIKSTGIAIEGKHAVVIGRSNLVGKPISILLLDENVTVTTCHSKTKDLKEITKSADILIVAIGKPAFVTSDMIKTGAVIIDVGINRTENGIVGDVDFKKATEIASYITPVPGGVGPMTIAALLENTFIAYQN